MYIIWLSWIEVEYYSQGFFHLFAQGGGGGKMGLCAIIKGGGGEGKYVFV